MARSLLQNLARLSVIAVLVVETRVVLRLVMAVSDLREAAHGMDKSLGQ
jgi:hypothetical protein